MTENVDAVTLSSLVPGKLGCLHPSSSAARLVSSSLLENHSAHMFWQAVLILGVLLVVGLLSVITWRAAPTSARGAFLLLYAIAGVSVIGWMVVSPTPTPSTPSESEANAPEMTQVANRPIAQQSDGYLGSQACSECHADQHASWYASYHRTMTQVVSPETVVGDFNDVTLYFCGRKYFLKRRGDEFLAEFDDPDLSLKAGKHVRVERRMVLSTGSHHRQIYWYPIADGSRGLGIFTFTWLKEDQRWVPGNSVFLRPHVDIISSEAGRWNMGCIWCHSTHGKPGIEFKKQPYGGYSYSLLDAQTNVAEFGISCEACHGPGQQHVNLHKAKKASQSPPASGEDSIVNPRTVSAQRSVEICGQCHGLHDFLDSQQQVEVYQKGTPFRPGEPLADSRLIYRDKQHYSSHDGPEAAEQMYWPDNVIRISGRELSAITNAPCFKGGKFTCLTCHQMHKPPNDPRSDEEWADDQLYTRMRSSHACTQCHDEFEDSQRLAAHTHHSAESSGSNCLNCHMSYTTYGLLKGIRNHAITSPNVGVTLETGRPNACNQCHLDQTLQWTANHLNDWYQISPPELSDDEQQIAASISLLLQGDAAQRALMAWSFGWPEAQEASGTEWMAPYLAQLLEDPYDAIRYIAQRSLRGLAGHESLGEYDYLSSADNWKTGHDEAFKKWQEQTKASPPAAPRLLIGADGELLREKYDELLRARNNRVVELGE